MVISLASTAVAVLAYQRGGPRIVVRATVVNAFPYDEKVILLPAGSVQGEFRQMRLTTDIANRGNTGIAVDGFIFNLGISTQRFDPYYGPNRWRPYSKLEIAVDDCVVPAYSRVARTFELDVPLQYNYWGSYVSTSVLLGDGRDVHAMNCSLKLSSPLRIRRWLHGDGSRQIPINGRIPPAAQVNQGD
jgi:hypothetical protein